MHTLRSLELIFRDLCSLRSGDIGANVIMLAYIYNQAMGKCIAANYHHLLTIYFRKPTKSLDVQ